MASKALPEMTVEGVQATAAYLCHHPVTDIPSLPLLPARSLASLARPTTDAARVQSHAIVAPGVKTPRLHAILAPGAFVLWLVTLGLRGRRQTLQRCRP